jgi:hypothetical protein
MTRLHDRAAGWNEISGKHGSAQDTGRFPVLAHLSDRRRRSGCVASRHLQRRRLPFDLEHDLPCHTICDDPVVLDDALGFCHAERHDPAQGFGGLCDYSATGVVEARLGGVPAAAV